MKIKENYLHEALKADKNEKPNWASETRRQAPAESNEAPNKYRQNDSTVKDELKFANLLESLPKPQKTSRREDSGDERGDEKKEQNEAAREKDSAETSVGEDKTGKYDSATGGGYGGQSGFGEGGVNHLFNLNENFAARSILHIADLERLVSTIRTQIGLGGGREVYLQLKRSVLEGLQVKIMTDGAGKVRIEFLAASEKARAEIEKHAGELAGILRGRGINLETIKTGVGSGGREDESSNTENVGAWEGDNSSTASGESISDDTFGRPPEDDGTIYNA